MKLIKKVPFEIWMIFTGILAFILFIFLVYTLFHIMGILIEPFHITEHFNKIMEKIER